MNAPRQFLRVRFWTFLLDRAVSRASLLAFSLATLHGCRSPEIGHMNRESSVASDLAADALSLLNFCKLETGNH